MKHHGIMGLALGVILITAQSLFAAKSKAPPVSPIPTNAPSTNAVIGLKTGDSFKLGPQDRLTFSLEDDPIKGSDVETVIVNALGNATFRVTRASDLSVTLNVAGKTIEEVRKELKAKLDEDYYQDARVKLDLKETSARFGQVLFIGQTRGNVLQLVPGEEKRIFESVFQIGVTEWANLKKVKLTRVDRQTQKAESWVIDLEEIKKGNRANNVLLQDGDIIDVPESMFNLK